MRNYANQLFTDRDITNCASKYTPSKYFQHTTSVLINGKEPFSSSCVHEAQAKSKSFVPIPVTLDIYRNWNHETIMYRTRTVENPDLNSRVRSISLVLLRLIRHSTLFCRKSIQSQMSWQIACFLPPLLFPYGPFKFKLP